LNDPRFDIASYCAHGQVLAARPNLGNSTAPRLHMPLDIKRTCWQRRWQRWF